MKKTILAISILSAHYISAQLYTSGGTVNSTTNSSSANVGIGTASPLANLHLVSGFSTPDQTGDLIIGNVNYPNLRFGVSNQYSWIQSHAGSPLYINYLGNNNLIFNYTGGNVGIGTISPAYKLDVKGTISSQDNSNEGGAIVLDNTTKTNPNTARKWVIYNMTGPYGNSLQFWNYSADGAMYGSRLKLSDEGNMALYGKLEAKEVKVTLTPTADFVFEEDYNLPKLEEVEKHIKERKHLPEIASAKEMEKEGVNVGEFQIKLLQKIEELTLYTIEQNKELKKQQAKINQLENENAEIKNLYQEVLQLKQQLK